MTPVETPAGTGDSLPGRRRARCGHWGDRHGQLDDPFGHRWNVSQHLRDVPHDEVVAAAARAFA
jgi:hypothetical protein